MIDAWQSRLLDDSGAARVAESLRSAGLRLVLTNGVFDLLHAGHVEYLEAARAAGDFLLVGLNSDTSVRRLKGPERPLVRERDRARLLLALRCVDGVVIFSEQTADALIEHVRPAVYVKGGDYVLSGSSDPGTLLPEEGAVRACGGEIRLIPFRPGYSTSGLVARLQGGSA